MRIKNKVLRQAVERFRRPGAVQRYAMGAPPFFLVKKPGPQSELGDIIYPVQVASDNLVRLETATKIISQFTPRPPYPLPAGHRT